MPGKILSSNVKPLGELNPDFVLSVKYLVDQTGVPIENSDQKFAKLIKTLKTAGFYSQVRPGEDSTLLLFIKVSDAVLLKALKSFHLKDYLYGVKNSIDDDEQILEHLSSAEKLRAAYSLISDPVFEGGAGITPGAGEWTFVEKIIPLYDYELTKRLITEWSKKPLIDENDIATIKDIAGEKVALYFGFLRFYTVWLVVPSVLGFVSYLFFSRYSIVFTILNLLWAIVMTNAWKKKENVYAITWNTKDSSFIETKRGEFVGETEEIDTVTGIKSPAFPSWKRTLRELAFIPVAIGAALVLVSYQFGCFFIEIFLNEIYDGPGKQFLSLVPTVLIVGFIPILTAGYTIFANKFLAWENHDTNTSYERSSVQKQFILNFLASYMPLFITSFVYLPFGHLVNPYLSFIQTQTSKYNISIQQNRFQINKDRLNQQFAYFAVTAQVVGFFLENIVPVVIRKVTEHFRSSKENNSAVALTDLPEEAQFLSEVRKQVALPPFNVNDEYREMVVQFGYLAIFGPVWSLAPIVSLVNNWIEFRGDAYKLFNETQRPIPVKADTIAPWNTNLRFLTWLATLVAPAITALFRQSDILEESEGSYLKSPVRIPAWTLFAVILFTEHFSIALNFIVEAVYNKIGTKTERNFKSNVYKTRRQYIDGYLQQTQSTGELEKRSVSIDPTEQHWENFSDEEVVKHAGIIPRQVLDAVALKKEKEEAEKKEAAILAEKKKAEAAQEKAHQQEISKANAQASNSSYQAYSENGNSNLQSRSTAGSKAIPETAASAISGAGYAAGTVVGAVGALTGSNGAQHDATAETQSRSTAPSQTGQGQGVAANAISGTGFAAGAVVGAVTGATAALTGGKDANNAQSRSTAPQTSQGYTAEYNTPGTSKVPADVQQKKVVPDAATKQFASDPHTSSTGPAAGIGATGIAAESQKPSNEYASSETSSSRSKSSSGKKGGFFSKLTKKDATTIGNGAKNDATKFSSQGQGIVSDVKKGDYSSSKKLATDASQNPDQYIGNTRDAFKQSNAGNSNPSSQGDKSGSSGYGSAATGGAVGAGVAGAGIAGHRSHGDASSHPNSSGTATSSSGYSDPSKTSSRQPQVSGGSSAGYDETSSRGEVEPQSSSVNPYNAVPKDTQSSHGKGATAAGLGAGAAGAGVASSHGSNDASSGVSPQKEEKKGGIFSRFSKKDATTIGKAAKSDATKFSGQAKDIASDVKKGDYSSAKKLAADAKENPDKYVGNTREAMKETKSGETSGATANQGANSGYGSSSTNANTSNAGSSSGYGAGTGAATGAGIAGAGIAGHHASKSGDATATSGSSSHPNSSGTATSSSGYNDPSTTSSRQPQVSAGSSSGYKDQTSSRGATQPDYETSSSSAGPVSRETQPSSSSSHGYGKEATGAGAAGLGAGGVAGAGVASNSSGSTEQSGTSENRKSGLFSRFSKKDASSVAKGAKEDASKFSGQAQGIASDVKKGDYSSAKKFAADAKENPDKYVGNTRSALNESKSGSSAAGTKDTTNAASQVPSDSAHTSGHGVGKGAAVGAGAAGAGAYAASTSHSGSTQQPQSSGKSTGASGSGSSSTGAAGATLPPQLASDGSNGYQSKSTSGAHTSSGHESSTGYTGSKHDVFGNQPPQALKNSDAKGYTSAQQAEQEPSSGGQSSGGQSSSGHAGTGAAAGAAIGGAGVAAHSQGKSNEAPSATKNEQGIPQNLSNPFTDGSAPQQQPNNPNADDVSGGEQKTLDPKSADQVKTSSGPDHQAPKSSTSKPSKVAATEDSHPTSLGGVDNQDKSSGGYGFGGIAAGLAGAAGATGLASKIGGGGSNQETKEGSIPSGGQKVSSNLSKDAAGGGYLDTAKGYAENAGTTFNDYVQVAADKADEYAKNSDNKFIGQGNQYVQQLAEKSDEYAKQHGESSTNKSVGDSKSSAGAAATKPSSGGKQSGQTELSNKSSKVGGAGATGAGATGAATSGSASGAAGSTSGTSASGSSAAAQFANKKSGQDEQDQSESLPKHFQHENKNPFSGKTGPVPGTEDQVIPHTQTSDIPKAEQGYGATHAAHGHTASAQPTKASDSLQPPRANAGYDTDSNSSTSSPKKRGLLSKIKQKVKGESSAPSSTQGTPKKTSA